jgi:hypothetical protein
MNYVITLKRKKMKKEDLIVGEWYKSSSWHENAIAKLKKYEEVKFYFTEAYIIVKSNTDFFYTNLENIRKATEEEIQRLLPDNHPDKNIRYVKCVKPYNNYGIVDIVYKKIGVLIYTSEGKSFQNSHGDTTILEWFIPSTKEAYDLQNNTIENPEYVECLTGYFEQFTNELTYKVVSSDKENYQLIDDHGLWTYVKKKHFKISTKEKFNKQENISNDLTEFPKTGYCVSNSHGLSSHL